MLLDYSMSSSWLIKIQNVSSMNSLKFIRWVIRKVPRWFVDFFVGGLFSVAYWGLKDLKAICQKNLRSIYGNSRTPDEYKIMTKQCIMNVGQCMMDLLYYVERPDALSRVVSVDNEERLKDALKAGRGAIVISAHLSNFPLMFISLVQRGYKVNVIIRPMRNKKFSKFMYQLCALWNINMIQLVPRRKFIKESLSVLKHNELLFIMLDEVVPEESGVVVDFFNRKVERAVGPVLFHERTGSPILSVFIVQDENMNFKIFVEEKLNIEKNFSPENNDKINITNLTLIIERFVRLYPTQWGGWLNRRWAVN